MTKEQEEIITIIDGQGDGIVAFMAEAIAEQHRADVAEHEQHLLAVPRGLTVTETLQHYRERIWNQRETLRVGLVLGNSSDAYTVDRLGAEVDILDRSGEVVEIAVEATLRELLWLRDRSTDLSAAAAYDTAIDVVLNRIGGDIGR